MLSCTLKWKINLYFWYKNKNFIKFHAVGSLCGQAIKKFAKKGNINFSWTKNYVILLEDLCRTQLQAKCSFLFWWCTAWFKRSDVLWEVFSMVWQVPFFTWYWSRSGLSGNLMQLLVPFKGAQSTGVRAATSCYSAFQRSHRQPL